jgi:hypothetical protein
VNARTTKIYNVVVSLSLPSGSCVVLAREIVVCACIGELTAEVPAECRGNADVRRANCTQAI